MLNFKMLWLGLSGLAGLALAGSPGPLGVQTCAELCNDGSDSGQDVS